MKKQLILSLAALTFSVMVSTTFAETSWKFIVTGDSRAKLDIDPTGVNTVILGELVDEIVNNGVELVLFSGDLVQGVHPDPSVSLQTQLSNWREIMQPVYDANIPVYPCRGNHEVMVIGSSASAIAWRKVFPELPDNGPAGGEYVTHEEYMTYSVTHKNAFIVALDQYVTSNRVNQDWLSDQLAGNTKPHIFVFGHEPAFQVKHDDCLDDFPVARNTFWASVIDAGGRVYFCSHDHFYNHAQVDDGDDDPNNDVHQYVIGTAGAKFKVDPWDWTYPGLNNPYTPINRFHAERKYGYVLVEVDRCDVILTWMERDTEDLNIDGTYQAKEMWRYTAVACGLEFMSYNILEKTRVGRTLFQYDCRVTLHNNYEAPVSDVRFELVSVPTNMSAIDPNATFTYIEANTSVASDDTCTFIVDRLEAIDLAEIIWQVTYEEADCGKKMQHGSSPAVFQEPESVVIGDFTGEAVVNVDDLTVLARDWLHSDSIADIAPAPGGDGIVDLRDFAFLVENWLSPK